MIIVTSKFRRCENPSLGMAGPRTNVFNVAGCASQDLIG